MFDKMQHYSTKENAVKEFIYPNAVVRVHHPDITKEERDRRMKQIYKAAEDVLKEKEKKNGNRV